MLGLFKLLENKAKILPKVYIGSFIFYDLCYFVINISVQEPKINTYVSFRDDVLPRIKKLGYNAVQIMAIQEHSYYASFG